MNRASLFALVPCMCVALGACAPDITKNETTPGVRAVFDDVNGIVPLPSDLLKGPDGNLNLPAQPGDSALTGEVKAALNDLDGWLTGSTITLPFDAPLDPTTVTTDSVLLVDLGDAYQAPSAQAFDTPYYGLFNVGREPATAPPYNVIAKIETPLTEFKQGRRYAVVVTDAVKGADGLPVITSPAFDLLKSRTPLVDDNGHSTILLPDDQAGLLEQGRSLIVAPSFDALEAKGLAAREHAVAYTVFSTQSGARPGFNPLLIGRVLPTPNDIDKPADAPLDVAPEVLFDLPYDVASVGAGTFMFKLGTGAEPVQVGTTTTETPNAQGMYPLKVVPTANLAPATTYAVVLTKDIKSRTGIPAQPSVYFTLVRAQSPIIDESTTPASLNSPFVDLTLDVLILQGKDPQTATAKDWDGAYNLLLSNLKDIEKLRVSYAPRFETVAADIPRENIIALWTFTTVAQ